MQRGFAPVIHLWRRSTSPQAQWCERLYIGRRERIVGPQEDVLDADEIDQEPQDAVALGVKMSGVASAASEKSRETTSSQRRPPLHPSSGPRTARLQLWSAATRFPELRADADVLIDDLKMRSQTLKRLAEMQLQPWRQALLRFFRRPASIHLGRIERTPAGWPAYLDAVPLLHLALLGGS